MESDQAERKNPKTGKIGSAAMLSPSASRERAKRYNVKKTQRKVDVVERALERLGVRRDIPRFGKACRTYKGKIRTCVVGSRMRGSDFRDWVACSAGMGGRTRTEEGGGTDGTKEKSAELGGGMIREQAGPF